MSNYIKTTDFAVKDSLPTGDLGKVVKGTEINTEFTNIASAISTKADLASPALTGTPTAPTATAGTSSTQIATTAFVSTAVTTAVTDAVDNINTLDTWTIVEASGVLYFKVGGVSKAKLDSSGNLTVVGDITAFGTI